MADAPTLTVSLSRKVNLGNYNSAEVFVSVSGIAPGMDADEIASLVAKEGKIAFSVLADAVKEKTDALLQGVL